MKWYHSRVVWGAVLIIGGILILLQNLGLFGGIALIWMGLFAAAGAAFLYTFLTNRAHWWALIPGFALLGLAATIGWEQLVPWAPGGWGGAFFLGALGMGFFVIYVTGRDRWWAIIPGGALVTLALVSGVSSLSGGTQSGGILFLGLGLTFGLLSLVPTPGGRMRWPLIPAAVLLLIGLPLLVVSMRYAVFFWPAVLIVGGLFLVIRALGFPRRAE